MKNTDILDVLVYNQGESIMEYFKDEYEEQFEEYINISSPRELLDAYLRYEGIHGYTDKIYNLLTKLIELKESEV